MLIKETLNRFSDDYKLIITQLSIWPVTLIEIFVFEQLIL